MRRTRSHFMIASVAAAVLVGTLAGCAQDSYDGVLWRQVAAFKDPFGQALMDMTGTEREALVADIKDGSALSSSDYWDGEPQFVPITEFDG